MGSPIENCRDSRTGLALSFAAIARALFSAHTVYEILPQVVGFSESLIDGCSGAAIWLKQDDEAITPAWSDPTVLEVDSMQYTTGEGPSLDAIALPTSVYAEDLTTDARWPVFAPLAAAAGIRSVLSFGLVGDETLGALNLYAESPRAFGADDRAKGLILATHTSVALAAAAKLEGITEALAVEINRLDNLFTALSSREIIGQAEGILMQRELITADQAFDLLRQASQQLNTKLRKVAQSVVDTGDIPGRPERAG